VTALTTIGLSGAGDPRWQQAAALWHGPCNVLSQTVF
jgi:hypothetical protein